MTAIDEIDARFEKYKNACGVMISRDEWQQVKKEIDQRRKTSQLHKDNHQAAEKQIESLTEVNAELLARVAGLEGIINSPELHSFADGVVLEASHQRDRWGADHDAGKQPADWFWLIGFLAGKALNACNAGNKEKALHHCISTAAAMNNWHAAILGANNSMRPGISAEKANQIEGGE